MVFDGELSVTLVLDPTSCKCLLRQCVILLSFVKICLCTLEVGEKMPLSGAYLTLSGLTVTLTFDLLTSKPNQFIFVTNCT